MSPKLRNIFYCTKNGYTFPKFRFWRNPVFYAILTTSSAAAGRRKCGKAMPWKEPKIPKMGGGRGDRGSLGQNESPIPDLSNAL